MRLRSSCLLPSLALVAIATAAGEAASPASRIDSAMYARPQQLVDIGGRRLHLYCAGSGSPTVIFDAGSGSPGWVWMHVHSQVAATTRACVYDRAGLGFSDAAQRPATAAAAADDLAALVRNARLPPPYVLVGHSYAAMISQLFASRHPQWMGGMVIVDGHHEDELPRLDRLSNGRFSQMMQTIADMDTMCLDAARAGFVPGSDAAAQCLGDPPAAAGRELVAAHLAQRTSVSYWEANHSEFDHLNGSSASQVRAERKSLGDLPVVVLTRGISPYQAPGRPPSAVSRAAEAENKRMQDDLAAHSRRSSNRVIAGAGHAIHIDRPAAVIEAVNEVVAIQRRQTRVGGN